MSTSKSEVIERVLESLSPEHRDYLVPTNHSFAEMTTLGIGGTPLASYDILSTIDPLSAETVAAVVSAADRAGVELLILGGGSNLVIGEEVSHLLSVRLVGEKAKGSENSAEAYTRGWEIDRERGTVCAAAGVVWDDLVAATVEAGFGGMECLSGIPGSVGATPVQNVGAYGAEISTILRRVQLYNRSTQSLEWVEPQDLELAYRYSNLKFTNRAVVTAVEFQLSSDALSIPLRFGELARRLGIPADASPEESRRPVAEVREAVLALRRGKGMVLDPEDRDTFSAGSFFTNPVVGSEKARDEVIAKVMQRCGQEAVDSMPVYAVGEESFKFSAAWLIDHAGFSKGWHIPNRPQAALSSKHTLALTNRGGASSKDIADLAAEIQKGVYEAFGVSLEPEPVFIGM